NGDGARNGPFHGADVGCVAVVPARGPDQFAGQGVDHVDAVAHRIGCRAVGVLVMVVRAVATAEYQCRYRLAAGPDLGQGWGRPGLPESGEAAGFRAYLPQHLRRVRIGNVKGIVMLATAAHAAVEVDLVAVLSRALPGNPAAVQTIRSEERR